MTKIREIEGIGQDTIKKLHHLNITNVDDLRFVKWTTLARYSHIGSTKIAKLYRYIGLNLDVNEIENFKQNLKKEKINNNNTRESSNKNYKINPPNKGYTSSSFEMPLSISETIDNLISITEDDVQMLNLPDIKRQTKALMKYLQNNKLIDYKNYYPLNVPAYNSAGNEIIEEYSDLIPEIDTEIYSLDTYDIPVIEPNNVTGIMDYNIDTAIIGDYQKMRDTIEWIEEEYILELEDRELQRFIDFDEMQQDIENMLDIGDIEMEIRHDYIDDDGEIMEEYEDEYEERLSEIINDMVNDYIQSKKDENDVEFFKHYIKQPEFTEYINEIMQDLEKIEYELDAEQLQIIDGYYIARVDDDYVDRVEGGLV